MASTRSYNFAMNFVAASEKYRQQYVERWREAVANSNMLDPDFGVGRGFRSPYRQDRVYPTSHRHKVQLKDPETAKVKWAITSILMGALFNHPRNEYVSCRPVGWEDAPQKAPTPTRLMRYVFSLPGHYRTFVEAIGDMVTFGTGMIESPWRYEEREMLVRTVEMTVEGEELSATVRLPVPVYDDVALRPLDVMDFYPDPSRCRIEEMSGAAKRFRMNRQEAMRMAKSGLYVKEAVKRAFSGGSNSDPGRLSNESFRSGMDQPVDTKQPADFREVTGYEYWGETPWGERRVITVLNNVEVRDDDYPLADPYLPFHALTINPIGGRFYGLSPCELIRNDQSLADAMKILLATAIIRQVHPPIAVDADSEADIDALKVWKADAPIQVRGGPNAIGTLRYDANVANGFAMLSGLKVSMQEAAGALGSVQGEEGPDRESATVGSSRYQFAMSRPDLAAQVLEKDALPSIGRGILRRYQQFLADTEDLKKRVGEMPEPIWLGDIMGDFDVQFVGSRQSQTNQQKLQGYDRLMAMSAATPLGMMVPWQQIGQNLIGDVLELPEVAAAMADPQVMMMNVMLTQMGAGKGPAGNGVPQGSEPPGMLPAQAGGGIG